MTLSSSRLPKTLVFIGIFVAALAVRVLFVFQWNSTPYGAVPLLDAQVYDAWAQAIADGQFFRVRAFYASPLFPYALALVYGVFGHSLLIAGLFNAMFGALTAVLLAALTLELFGLEAALVTGVLAAFYRPLIFYTAPVMKEPLGLLLLTIFLMVVLRALKQNRMRDFFWSGALLGLCALVRGNIVLLAPAVLVVAVLKWRGKSLKGCAVFVAALVLFIAPATIHNYIASRDFVPINYADGFNLYIGNSPTANGTNEYPPEISSDPVQEELATIWVARERLGHEPLPSEVSTFWRDRAFDYMLHNPEQELVLLRNKAAAFWNTAEPFDSYDIGFIRENFGTILNAPLPEFWLIALLAAFGAAAAWPERRGMIAGLGVFTFVYTASVLLFYVTDRYRLPVTVFLLPLAGAALPCGWRLVLAKHWLRLGGASLFALLVLFISLLPLINAVDLTAFHWGTLSTIYSDLGRDREAIKALHKAVAISPTEAGAQAFVRGSFAEQRLGDDDEAERLLKTAMELYPHDGVAQYNYGRFKAGKGDMKAALAALQKAVELTPTYVLNYYALAKVYERLGDRAHAVEYMQRGLVLDSSNALLLEMQAQLQQEKGLLK